MSYSVLIFVPAFRDEWSTTTALATHGLRDKLTQVGIGSGISSMSFPDIAELRSMAVSLWYDTTQFSHLLFVDNDMGFPPDLVMEMLAFGEGVVGTLYPQRKLPQSWAGSGTGGEQTERRGNFMHVEGTGMGCTLISREAIRVLLEKFPELDDKRIDQHPMGAMIRAAGGQRLFRCFEKLDLTERGVVSEDLSFCIRWNMTGGKVWANMGHFMNHVGKHDFGGRYLDVIEAKYNEQVAAAPSELPGLVNPIFTDIRAPAVPVPGGAGEQMSGGPGYRDRAGAELAAVEAIAAAEAELAAREKGKGNGAFPPPALSDASLDL